MDTQQIDISIRNYPSTKGRFLGVFSSDQIPTKLSADTCFVANTDPKDRPGKHWVAFYISPIKRVYYFDAFGLPPYIPSFKHFMRLSQFKASYNRKQLQRSKAQTCGPHCVYFLQETCRTRLPQHTVRLMSRNRIFNDRLVYQRVLQ